MKRYYLILAAGAILLSCKSPAKQKSLFTATASFNTYWNAGLAEISHYSLTQARYGHMHSGEMIAIFVTEPFRTDKQVKSELTPGKDDTLVLKAQLMRRFATGIYDYQMTTTSFKPLDTGLFPQALKVSGSAVDWCGHGWTQLNLNGNAYKVQLRSYFEAEGDRDFKVSGEFSEDEIWQQIRMHPQFLPKGETQIIPSLLSTRLRHRPLQVEKAFAEKRTNDKGARSEFSLRYGAGTDAERQVSWVFENTFPHRILEYRETYLDGFQKKQKLTTIARLTKTIRNAYWREHEPQHLKSRHDLGVKGFEP